MKKNLKLVARLALGVFVFWGCPELNAADWSSLHGSNSAPREAPAARPQPPVNREPPAPVVRAVVPETRPIASQARPQPQQAPIQSRAHSQPLQPQQAPANRETQVSRETQIVDRGQLPHAAPAASNRSTEPLQQLTTQAQSRAAAADRRRSDVDEDRRQSFFWSDFHPGMRTDRLPEGCHRVNFHNHPYFYFEGVYYDSQPWGYAIIAPPIGVVVPELPPGAEIMVVGGTVYYYAGGVFYIQQPGGFGVVAAPIGVDVAVLPPNATTAVVNGMVYYQADGTWYQPIMLNGVASYVTVPQP
jgi:hypothetical protein